MSKQKQTTGTFLTDGVWTGLWAPVRYHLETQSLLLAVEVQRLQGLQHTNSTHAQKTRNLQASRLNALWCTPVWALLLQSPGLEPFELRSLGFGDSEGTGRWAFQVCGREVFLLNRSTYCAGVS